MTLIQVAKGQNKNITQQEFYNFTYKHACIFATHTSDNLTSGYTYNNDNGTITKDANGAVTIDGGTLTLNMRILVKNQTALSQNGVYTVTTVGSGSAALVLTRADDFNSPTEIVKGSYIAISDGSNNANTAHVLSTNATTTVIGTTELTFTNVSSVPDESITLAKMAHAAANTVLVRDANSTGDPSFKAVTDQQILIGTGTGFTAAALSGDVTMTNAGAVSLIGAQTHISSIYNDGLKVGKDSHNQFDFATDNVIKVSVNATDDEFRFVAGGHFHADDDITAFSTTTGSDKRLKKNIKDINYGLKDILNLRGVEFDWKEKRNGKHDIGFIAQEVQEVIPEVINEIPNKDNEDDKYLGVEYSKIVPILVESIKEQQKQIDSLKCEVESLKNK